MTNPHDSLTDNETPVDLVNNDDYTNNAYQHPDDLADGYTEGVASEHEPYGR